MSLQGDMDCSYKNVLTDSVFENTVS